MSKIIYSRDTCTLEDIKQHLQACNTHFVPHLSTYVDITQYAEKIHNRAVLFEAWDQCTLVGLVALYVDRTARSGFITNVSADPSHQGTGLSSKLITSCVAFLESNAYIKVSLEVNKHNIRAISFYQKHNFLSVKQNQTSITMELTLSRNYNKELQDTADHKYAYNFDFDVMHHYMIESFKPHFLQGSCLELGSFKGDFTKRLVPHFDDITCVEASDEAVFHAKNQLGDRVTFINALFEEVDLPKKYDNIILTHVLEHIDDPVALLSKIKTEWLSDNGKLFVVCPNGNAPSRQIAVKMGLISHNTAITPAEAEHGHRITYTLDTLERDAKASKLNVICRSGIFFKALANFQWDQLLNTSIISKEYLDGCYQLGQQYPDLCSSILLICKKN